MNKTQFTRDRIRAGLSDEHIHQESLDVWPAGISYLSIRRHRAAMRRDDPSVPSNAGAAPRKVRRGTAGGTVKDLVERLVRAGLTNSMVVGAAARELGREARLDENKVASVRVALRKADPRVLSDQDARTKLGLPRRTGRKAA